MIVIEFGLGIQWTLLGIWWNVYCQTSNEDMIQVTQTPTPSCFGIYKKITISLCHARQEREAYQALEYLHFREGSSPKCFEPFWHQRCFHQEPKGSKQVKTGRDYLNLSNKKTLTFYILLNVLLRCAPMNILLLCLTHSTLTHLNEWMPSCMFTVHVMEMLETERKKIMLLYCSL